MVVMITAGCSADKKLHLPPLGFRPAAPLLSHTGLWRTFATFLAFLLEPVYVERLVLERSGEQRSVGRGIRLDGLTKSRVGGFDKVQVVLSRSIHDLMEEEETTGKVSESSGFPQLDVSIRDTTDVQSN